MIYNNFQDLKLSALGMGAMRLPVIDGNDGKIDAAAARRYVRSRSRSVKPWRISLRN